MKRLLFTFIGRALLVFLEFLFFAWLIGSAEWHLHLYGFPILRRESASSRKRPNPLLL
jgi:hypothetical protein